MKRSDFLNGKVKAEFGNLDQIKMVKQIEESDKAFKEGFIPDIKSTTIHRINTRCHCDETSIEFEAEGEDEDCLINETARCHKCKRDYIIRSQQGFIVIMYNNARNSKKIRQPNQD